MIGAVSAAPAALLAFLPYLPPTEIGSIQQMIYGLAMVLLMIFRPSGLWGYGDSRTASGVRHDRRDPVQADASKTFGGVKAVDDVSFALAPASSPRWSGPMAPARRRCSTP